MSADCTNFSVAIRLIRLSRFFFRRRQIAEKEFCEAAMAAAYGYRLFTGDWSGQPSWTNGLHASRFTEICWSIGADRPLWSKQKIP